MRSNSLRLVTIAELVVLIIGVGCIARAQTISDTALEETRETQTVITYCNLKLSEGWKLGNLTFNALYSFRVDENGRVVDIRKIRDDFIGNAVVESCISKWKIIGIPNKSAFVVYFNWKHGHGWIEQRISGNRFIQVMRMEGVGVNKQ
jgi:hypothetical protein